MRRILMLLLLMSVLTVPVSALDITPPPAPDNVQDLMPVETESFGQGLWKIVKAATGKIAPELSAATGCCLAMVAVVLLTSILNATPGNSKKVVRYASTLALSAIMLGQANAMIHLCAGTVDQITDYSKLLLPAMTTALAAQGGITGATALYAGTTVFNTILSTLIGKLLVPVVYIFLALAVANSATGEDTLKKIRDFVKWFVTWCLKTILYIFTGYMSITGVITGTADAAAVKAAKLTISGVVPVVGGILSDASEAVIISAGVVKNAVGIYGLLAVAAIWISPFLQIGLQFLLLKLTAVLCGVFGVKEASDLIEDFSTAMGLLVAMTGAISFLTLISSICFMKGMG